MTYQEIKDRLTKCENTLNLIKNGQYKTQEKVDIKETTKKLEVLRESLQKQLAEADKGTISTDDEEKAKDLADDGANVNLTSEMKPGDPEDLERKRMDRLTPEDREKLKQIRAMMKNANNMEEAEHQAEEDDLDVGHTDDEPSMLKKDLYDIITNAAKLYKQLHKYDQGDGEVDFPHWWQSKVIKAKDYIGAAQHYLEAEEKQPAIDQLALEEGVEEGMGSKIIDKVKSIVQKNISKLGTDTIEDIKTKVEKALGKPISSLGMSDISMDNAKKVATQFGLNEGSMMDKYPKFFGALGLGGLATAIGFGTAGIASGPMVLVGMAAMLVAFISTFEKDEGLNEARSLSDIQADIDKVKKLAPSMNKLPQDDPKRKGFIAKVKKLNQEKKDYEAGVHSKVAKTGADQELDTTDEALPTGFGTGLGRSKTISKGRESRPDLAKARKDAIKPKKKYVMKNGIPHKYDEDGNLVPLKRMNEEDKVGETKEAPAGHYFTKSGNLVKGKMTKDAKERGARKSDPKDKTRSKVPSVSQYK